MTIGGEVAVLKVGETVYDFGGINLAYAGMPSEDIFSIGVIRGYLIHYSFNLFFPISSKEIEIDGTSYEVANPKPESIMLKHLRR